MYVRLTAMQGMVGGKRSRETQDIDDIMTSQTVRYVSIHFISFSVGKYQKDNFRKFSLGLVGRDGAITTRRRLHT